MKKVLLFTLASILILSLCLPIFAENSIQTEEQTEPQTEEQTEPQTEEQTEPQTESQTEKETENNNAIVFPYILLVTNVKTNESKVYGKLFEELQNNKIGQPLTLTEFNKYKMQVINKYKITQPDLVALKCAELNKGYFLKVTIDYNPIPIEGSFELIDPSTLEVICKAETTHGIAVDIFFNASINKSLKSGIAKFALKLKETLPELIMED